MSARRPRVGRLWRGRTASADALAYERHLREETLPSLGAIPGFEEALVLRRAAGDDVEFLALTLWASEGAIRRFAGPDEERAVIPPAAAAVLKDWDERARHFQVALDVRAEDR